MDKAKIERAFRHDRRLQAAGARWQRSGKNWVDRAMLINAVLTAVDSPADADAEDRIAVFHAAKAAIAAVGIKNTK